MKSIYPDMAVGLWVLLVGAMFIVPLVCCEGAGRMELELVGRYVYLSVLTVGLIGLALRALHR